MSQSTQILDADAGGLMLADSDGNLQLMTSTSEDADLVEVMQLNAHRGPCIECFSTGVAVSVPDIDAVRTRWPEFHAVAMRSGLRSAHATPLRLRGQVIGTMNLFGANAGQLSKRDAALAQALSDVATISILQDRISQDSTVLAEQLHRALDSRIIIEQAKGMIAYSQSISMDAAFAVIRAHARNNNLSIRNVAEGISNRTIAVTALAARRSGQ